MKDLMIREELIDNMVSCYDNGEAMLEYVEEYYAQRTCEGCKLFVAFNTKQDGMDGQCEDGVALFDGATYKEFGCNRWEKKNER